MESGTAGFLDGKPGAVCQYKTIVQTVSGKRFVFREYSAQLDSSKGRHRMRGLTGYFAVDPSPRDTAHWMIINTADIQSFFFDRTIELTCRDSGRYAADAGNWRFVYDTFPAWHWSATPARDSNRRAIAGVVVADSSVTHVAFSPTSEDWFTRDLRDEPAGRALPDLLPFAVGKELPELEAYPQVGFGLGVSMVNAPLDNMDAALVSGENWSRPTYPWIPYARYQISSLALLPSIHVRISPHFMISAESATSLSGIVTYRDVAIGVTDRIFHPKIIGAYPFVRAMLGYYAFVLENSTTGDGGYKFVENASGGNIGVTLGGGLEFPVSARTSIDAFAEYLFTPDMNGTSVSGRPFIVNLSGFTFGGRLRFY